jgi:putrescine aminotransferase
MVILEPVQGEAGVVLPPPGYLRGASSLCRAHGALLVVDEIQTGLGRLGHWWGVDAEDVVPDVMLVGKGLSGGVVPVAAMVATAEAYAPFAADPYLHSSTFAGSPIASAAAGAAVETIRDEHLVARAATLGDRLLRELRTICTRRSPAGLLDVRGRGLLIGVEFADPGAVGELALQLIEHGVLACHSLNASRVLRFTPPAILTDSELETFLRAFSSALAHL